MSKRMYVLVNEDLAMSRGKVAAQVAHVVSRLYVRHPSIDDSPDTTIVLAATGEQIRNLSIYLTTCDIRHTFYVDEGVNEIPAYSMTALAIEPLEEEHGYAMGPYTTTELNLSGFDLLRDLEKKKGWFR